MHQNVRWGRRGYLAVYLTITEATQTCILNNIKGRLYLDRKTMRIAGCFISIPEKELVVYDKAEWHYEGEFPQELDIFQAYVPTGMFFVGWVLNC